MTSPIQISDFGWGDVLVRDLYEVLCSVVKCFRIMFGKYFNEQLVRIIHLDDANPRCDREGKHIFLTSSDKYYSKYVYQFAHEYCHYQLPFSPVQELRWLEESICELASLYTLRQVDKQWEVVPPYPNWRNFHSNFTKYAENAEKSYESINLDFSVEPNEILSYLRREEYDRAKNMYIALKLLPLFYRRPELWHSVPFLCRVNERRTFHLALKEWQQVSPAESRAALAELALIFSIEL